MTPRVSVILGLVIALAGAVVWACGPEFPNQLLDDRGKTLKAAPPRSFADDARRLLPATDTLQAVEPDPYAYESDAAKPATDPDLSAAQLARIAQLREADSGDTAYAQGADLPEDVRGYIAGAVDYARSGQAACDTEGAAHSRKQCDDFDNTALDQAQARFEGVLALPADQARLRSVWAAYMLGEVHGLRAARAAGTAAFTKEREAAGKAFEQSRLRAVAGASDSQGLAVASFGEQASLYLYAGATECGWDQLNSGAACATAISPADFKHAIALYAAQAGHGSHSGLQSLVVIADVILASPALTQAMIDGPLSQRLLVSYAIASAPRTAEDGKFDPRLTALIAAIENAGLDKVEGADRLASLAYQAGRYELAGQLAAKAPSALASWIQAKLAVQKGDLAGAAQAYAEAAKGFPAEQGPKAPLGQESLPLILGEQGVLSLARGDYLDAMGHLFDAASQVGGEGNVVNGPDLGYGAGYAADLAYIGERVLTLDELKGFVDARVPAAVVVAPKTTPTTYTPMALNDRLRWLLARRLMRAGRFDEAQGYFPVAFAQPNYSGQPAPALDLRAKAGDYARALHDAEHAWTDIGAAQARFAAASIARQNGMELLGYEQAPDYNDNDGSYPGGSGHARKSLSGPFVTGGELQRYDTSAAMPGLRFHYRYVAVDLASAAADQLPPRSQAFAAVLCQATGWMFDGPGDSDWFVEEQGAEAPTQPAERDKRAAALYARYLKQGAVVPWASHFGHDCPSPDFDAARQLQRKQLFARVRHGVRHEWPFEVVGVLALGGAVVLLLRRRRRKA